MKEGWFEEDYLVLFSDEEARHATEQYQLHLSLPDFTVVGLRGWDDLLVQDKNGQISTVPAVPLIESYLEPYSTPPQVLLEPDSRFHGQIKWYIKPVAFGGDPTDMQNTTWVTHEQHHELVCWWNTTYREMSSRRAQ